MANILAAQNGNWSSSSTWTGGTIPSSTDNVYSNNKNITIDTNITVVKISNKAENGATGGGKFTLNNGVVVNANIEAGTTTCVDTAVQASATINGNITGGSALAGRGLDNTSSGTITISGNVTGGSASYSSGTNFAEGVRNSGTGSIYITGSISAGSAFGYNYGVLNFSTGSIVVSGNVTGGSIANGRSIVNYGGGAITITGTCYGSFSNAVYSETTSIGGTVTIYGDCYGSSNAGSSSAVLNNSISDVYTIYGNCYGGTGSVSSQHAVNNNSTGTVNIIGNCTGGYNTPVGNTSSSKVAALNSATGTMSITGNIYGGPKANTGVWTNAGSSHGAYNGGNGILNITGDAYGSSSAAVSNAGAGTINITGNSYITTTPLDFGSVSNGSTTIINVNIGTINITGNVYGSDNITHASSLTVNNSSTGTININGICYAGLTCSAARNSAGGVLDVKRAVGNAYGNPLTNGQVMASYGVHSNASTSITYVEEIQFGSKGNVPINGIIYPKLNNGLKVIFRNQGNSSETTIVNTSVSTDYPSASDVRKGVSYSFGNITGVCNIPSSNNVSLNVPVGTGIGSAILTASDFFNFNVSGVNANSIWTRLNNCATVETTVAQIAAAFSDN